VYFWKRIMRVSGSPHAVAAGAAAGAFASFTPLVGFHFILSFVLAFLVRGNMLAAALGTAVGNPLTFPLIWGATFELGKWILSGGADPMTAAGADMVARTPIGEGLLTVGFERLWPIMKPMLVGSIPLGLLVATVMYVVVFAAVRGVQRRRQARLLAKAEAALIAEKLAHAGQEPHGPSLPSPPKVAQTASGGGRT
jgi:uncharacterized protein